MLLGRLDAITSSGYIEGWAYDDGDELRALTISVVARGAEQARGLANVYRWDLVEAGCGTGWCAFRLKLAASTSQMSGSSVILQDVQTHMTLYQTSFLPVVQDGDTDLVAISDLIVMDPTLVHSIDRLRGCDKVLEKYIGIEGPEAFVRAAYVYILGRPADSAGLAFYCARLEDDSITPYALLKVLYESDEFQSSPRALVAPPHPGFVFRQT